SGLDATRARRNRAEAHMRLGAYVDGDTDRACIVEGEEIVDLRMAAPDLPHDVAGILGLGAAARDRLARAAVGSVGRLSLADVRLAAPVRPRKFFAVGLNYADHVAEVKREF